jgi:hypothetical protein
MDVVEITELEKIDADRVDGVGSPASGIPILLMKAAAAPVAKGKRDCPKCDKTFDADHKGGKCPECGADLPDGDDAAKGAEDREAAKSLVRDIIAKAADRKGNIDEAPDIAGGTAVIMQIADLIISECQEIKAGQFGEVSDVLQLASAADLMLCWRSGEQAVASGTVMPATALMQSASMEPLLHSVAEAVARGDIDAVTARKVLGRPEAGERFVKAKHSAADRRKLAEAGNALSDGSYPIADEEDLKSAAILAQSGHGDVDGAKRLIGRRAKELGVKNPLGNSSDDDASKGIAKEGGTVDTVTQGSDGLEKAVADAVAKASAPLEKLRKELEDTLAKVRATPIPGGPVLSRNVQVRTPGGVQDTDMAAKAALYRQKATEAVSPADRDGYLALARETEQAARAKPA